MVRNDIAQPGYDQEEAYFYKKNKELLEKRRKELDAQKDQQTDRTQMPYWMRCPKCGEQMNEVDLSGIKVDQCSGCQGMYFDAGELQTLISAQEPKGFFGLLRKKIS